jgi:hypothetical protein
LPGGAGAILATHSRDATFCLNDFRMIVIRRLVERERAFTAIFLPGEPARIFPTNDYEHARILQIYKQDRRYPDVLNDFSDFELNPAPPKQS